jgi:hypothetical protein
MRNDVSVTIFGGLKKRGIDIVITKEEVALK